MVKVRSSAAMVLSLAAGAVQAQSPRRGTDGHRPSAGDRDVGRALTIMIPGSPVGGFVSNNGNGTSTVIVPGSEPPGGPDPALGPALHGRPGQAPGPTTTVRERVCQSAVEHSIVAGIRYPPHMKQMRHP